jgi:cell division protein FtsQ
VSSVLRAEGLFRARRNARRRQVLHRRFVRPAVVLAVAVTLAGGVVWAAWSSPLLAVQTVTVKGTSRLSAAEILAAAQVPVGRSLLRVDPGRIRARVAALAAVRAVTVDRDWPHRLVITVTERQPVAAVRIGGAAELVDATGVAFATADPAPPGLLPLVLGAAVPGAGDEDARAALAVWAELPAALRGAVRSIAAPSPSDVTLRLTGRRTVIWGDPGESARKLVVLRALMRERASTYDVSTPDVPVTKP